MHTLLAAIRTNTRVPGVLVVFEAINSAYEIAAFN